MYKDCENVALYVSFYNQRITGEKRQI